LKQKEFRRAHLAQKVLGLFPGQKKGRPKELKKEEKGKTQFVVCPAHCAKINKGTL